MAPTDQAAPRLPRVAALTCLLTAPSLYLIEKYGGLRALPVYVVAVGGAAWAWEIGLGRRIANRISERQARVAAVVSFLLLIAFFAVVYPIANSGRFGRGSDCDEALNQGARALLHGRFPYYERTYLNNELTPMPGELLLAMPFVLVGDGVYQWPLWLGAGALVLWTYWRRETALTWLFSLFVLVACPAVLHLFVVGNDYLTNALMILLPALGLVTAAARGAQSVQLGALAVALGLALSSRATFAFVLPLVLSRLWQTQRARTAMLTAAAIVVTAAAVTLPFFLYDPAGFSPLGTRRKLTELNVVLPHVDLLLPAAAVLLSLALARPRWNQNTKAFLRNAALVQGIVLFVPALLHAMSGRPAPTSYTSFGTLFLPFGLAVYVATTPRSRLGQTPS
jgi:hypothetical protein